MNFKTDITNVLIIGCGGSGLRAAIEVSNNQVSVKVLGKRFKNDAHTVLAAGGINASFGNLDKQDSWQQHFADTYLEGYGIGNPDIIKIMAQEAPKLVEEIDKWGANFAKLNNGLLDQRFFGAHTYRRTCYSGDYTGQTILNTLLEKCNSLNIPIYDEEYVTEILVEDKKCFGAISFNIFTGQRTVHLADSVIICTGGHTKIWKKSSSRKQENLGDGYYLSLQAGCNLIDMEMVQFHPTGMVLPKEMAGTLVTEAVRGEGGILINGIGERYMKKYDPERMELSTRDKIAVANYIEICEGRNTPNGGVYLDISHKEKDFLMKKIPKIFRQFIEIQNIDISKEPMEVAPTAHYSMGGIKVDPYTHSTNIEGLFAAGEVAGGLHGANRLGGNSLAEILIFGKMAGKYAAEYAKNLEINIRSTKSISNALNNIDMLIKSGDELVIPLQNELSEIMWKYAGVIKDEYKLKKGLEKIAELKSRFKYLDVRVNDRNYQDLINAFDLQSSLLIAEATIASAIERKESRGAHQRSDFKKIDNNEKCNYQISFNKENISIKRVAINQLDEELKNIIKKTKPLDNFKNKLLE